MPTSCPCELIGDGYDVYCSFAGGVPRYIKEYDECCQNGTRPSWCPLVEIPPHGRLIDADALQKRMIDYGWKHPDSTIHEFLEDDAPTIIESTMGQVNSEKAVNEAEEGE